MSKVLKSDVARYTTGDELQFLERLQRKNRKAYDAYRTNFNRRTNWGDVDKWAVAAFLENANQPTT